MGQLVAVGVVRRGDAEAVTAHDGVPQLHGRSCSRDVRSMSSRAALGGSASSSASAPRGWTARTCSVPPVRWMPQCSASSSYSPVRVKSTASSGPARSAGSHTRSSARGSPPPGAGARGRAAGWTPPAPGGSRRRRPCAGPGARTMLRCSKPWASTVANRLASAPSGCRTSTGASYGRRPRLAVTTPSSRRRRRASRTVCRLTAYSLTRSSSPGNEVVKAPAATRRRRSSSSCCHSGADAWRCNDAGRARCAEAFTLVMYGQLQPNARSTSCA